MKIIALLGTFLFVATIAFGQIQEKGTIGQESARRLEKIRRIAAESQGKIEVTVIAMNSPVRQEEVKTARDSESARRLRKIQKIAAESQGKIEITVIPLSASSGREDVKSTYVVASNTLSKTSGKRGGYSKGRAEVKGAFCSQGQ